MNVINTIEADLKAIIRRADNKIFILSAIQKVVMIIMVILAGKLAGVMILAFIKR